MITGLTNGTAYNFTVTASNLVGESSTSAPSNTVTPATAPDAPTSVSAVAGNATLAASWSTPSVTGGTPILSYTATASPGGVTCAATAPAVTCTINGLTNGTTYFVSVVATNGVGSSPAGTAVGTRPLPGAPAPIALVSSGVGTASHQVTVIVPSGAAVDLLDGTSAVTTLKVPGEGAYTLDPSTGDITFVPTTGLVGTANPVTFRLTDSFGQTGTSTYTPTVTAPVVPKPTTPAPTTPAPTTPAPVPPTVSVTLPAATGSATLSTVNGVHLDCATTTSTVTACTIVLYAMDGTRRTAIGSAIGGDSLNVVLTSTGRDMIDRVGGRRVLAVAQITVRGAAAPMSAESWLRVVLRGSQCSATSVSAPGSPTCAQLPGPSSVSCTATWPASGH